VAFTPGPDPEGDDMAKRVDRRSFLTGAAGTVALATARSAWSQGERELPGGFVRLRALPGDLNINGKPGKGYRIEREDGGLGWYGARGDRFRVALDNGLEEPVAIHWHGLILPSGQDGVPYVTQPPIKPGERRLYDFPLVQAGTYWMHSHFGLQEQWMLTAPLIIRDDPASPGMRDVVIMLNDFTVRDPAAILADLRSRPMKEPMIGMRMGGAKPKMSMKADLTDVTYDAFLANRRSLADPEVFRVTSGEAMRLRIINMASGTNFFVGTGRLPAQAIAVDGEDIVPLPGTRFELGVAQRVDLRVVIPRGEGAYPILAEAEGTDGRAGVVLATAGAAVPAQSPRTGKPVAGLTNRQESRLRALRPLARRHVDRRLRVALGGDMTTYVWSLNGQVWPRITPLEVKQGERVELTFANETSMTHPMHLHGHVFHVVAIDGMRLPGARRDTVLVMPGQTVTVELDALYPGYWMIHCHLLYHQAAGMMTVLHYQGFENRSYDPLASLAEFPRR
jgi:FtsP/CotA-like multicopper oxidase with cupredoxin domain